MFDPIHITSTDLSCKIVVYKLQTKLLCIYRPPNNDYNYLYLLYKTLKDLSGRYPKAIIWIAGDLNLPIINWTNFGNNYPLSMCDMILDTKLASHS